MTDSIMAKTLVARCEAAGLTGIYKSYIRNIKCVDRRREADWFMEERDYSFDYKGNTYIVRSEIVGDKRASARFKYTVEII